MSNRGSLLRRYVLILALEGWAALGLLLCLPGEAAGVFGISPARLALALILGGLTAGLSALWCISRRPQLAESTTDRAATFIQPTQRYAVLLGILALAFLACGYTLWFSLRTSNAFYQGILLRLSPALLWAAAGSLEGLFFCRALRGGGKTPCPERQLAWLGAGLFLVQAGLGAFVMATRIGLTRDYEVGLGWGDPGAPLLAEQVSLVLLVCLLLTGIYQFFLKGRLQRIPLDALIFLAVWGLAAALWLAQPIQPTYFSPAPRPPNYEFYPYSDAGDYDRAAQNLLVGAGLGGVAKRPLYSLFLAGLHTLAGGDFTAATSLQVVVLAAFPALLYLLGRRAGSRFAGLLLGGLVILRECNAMALSGAVNVSHSRLLMSDLPSAMGIALLALAGTAWLGKPQKATLLPLLNGGLLGLLMLVRSQSVLLGLPLLILAGVQLRRQPRLWLKQAAFFALGLVLALLPWLVRNYALTGQLVFEESGQISALARRYSLAPSETTGGEGSALEFVRTNPAQVAGFAAAHFLHNWIDARFILPVNFRLVDLIDEGLEKYPYWRKSGEPPDKMWTACCSLLPYVNEDVPYWRAWDGKIRPDSFIPLLLGFALSAAGISAAWRKWGGAGLLPGGFFLAYALSCALIRSSGWRYILPVDWVVLFYYALGISALLGGLGRFFFPSASAGDPEPPIPVIRRLMIAPPAWTAAGLCCLILLAGSAVPAAEALIPPRYPSGEVEQVLDNLPPQALKAASLSRDDLTRFLDEENALAVNGRALYPKIFLAGEDDPWYSNWEGQRPRAETELDFLVIGSAGSLPVVLPLGAQGIGALRHASDVLILGWSENGILTANVVFVLDGGDSHLLQSSHPIWNRESGTSY